MPTIIETLESRCANEEMEYRKATLVGNESEKQYRQGKHNALAEVISYLKENGFE